MEIIALIILFILFYIVYIIVVRVAKSITDSGFKQDILNGELKKEGSKFSFKLKDWFVWNVQVNNEKGTAGGNVKINFPIKSALGLCFICLLIAALGLFTPVTAWVIPSVFISFAFYYFIKWFHSLKLISNAVKEKTGDSQPDNILQLKRASENKILGGVCRGIQQRYGMPVILVRILFIGGPFLGFTLILYLLLWYFLPETTIQK